MQAIRNYFLFHSNESIKATARAWLGSQTRIGLARTRKGPSRQRIGNKTYHFPSQNGSTEIFSRSTIMVSSQYWTLPKVTSENKPTTNFNRTINNSMGCTQSTTATNVTTPTGEQAPSLTSVKAGPAPEASKGISNKVALGAGCFWGVQKYIEKGA